MNIFHRHRFDPGKWKLLYHADVKDEDGSTWHKFIYTNTCTECGKLVEKKIETQ